MISLSEVLLYFYCYENNSQVIVDGDMDSDDDWRFNGLSKNWNFSGIWKMADFSQVSF